MKKNLLTVMAVLIMSFAAMLAMVACGSNGNGGSGGTGTGNGGNSGNGVPSFVTNPPADYNDLVEILEGLGVDWDRIVVRIEQNSYGVSGVLGTLVAAERVFAHGDDYGEERFFALYAVSDAVASTVYALWGEWRDDYSEYYEAFVVARSGNIVVYWTLSNTIQ